MYYKFRHIGLSLQPLVKGIVPVSRKQDRRSVDTVQFAEKNMSFYVRISPVVLTHFALKGFDFHSGNQPQLTTSSSFWDFPSPVFLGGIPPKRSLVDIVDVLYTILPVYIYIYASWLFVTMNHSPKNPGNFGKRVSIHRSQSQVLSPPWRLHIQRQMRSKIRQLQELSRVHVGDNCMIEKLLLLCDARGARLWT